MIFFSSKIKMNKRIKSQQSGIEQLQIEMNKKIKSQQSEIEQLQIEKKRCLNDNADLKALVEKLQEENREYQEQYIRTGLECAFCYTTLQENFAFCPKCGKKINKAKKRRKCYE